MPDGLAVAEEHATQGHSVSAFRRLTTPSEDADRVSLSGFAHATTCVSERDARGGVREATQSELDVEGLDEVVAQPRRLRERSLHEAEG